jgi:hypothetical protein
MFAVKTAEIPVTQERSHVEIANKKKILIIFFDINGIVHFDFIVQG